ncbi:protein kinase domain-containing protein [Mycolicibacterium komossense]|uniref:non-specific serine/threonine protein kinase n=1 Tax=Mycolicibacterium komossense TaxID=1779 RepID=A0ABT3CHS2_9MYCO|nr:protein kinase [Mycolicibacterium komossense]MCV7229071.1 protein kinase [Mycolicibacterium komossense]
MPLGVGQTFAGYRIVGKLGAGGMGEVYLAQHPRLPRRDALKLLSSGVSADNSFRTRFLREADLACTLRHPHIVGVLDRGEVDDQLWISMDYVDGEDAGGLLSHRYPAGMPHDLVITIIRAVASALDYAHKRGLLHRDVKPANIMLSNADNDAEHRTFLTDFGIARVFEDESGLTETNMTVGTVDYAAPEQLLGDNLDSRADQYSLAATTYHLLSGTPPFRDPNPAVVISRHLNAVPAPLSATRPDLAAYDDVLARGLSKRPEDRYDSCSQFASALSASAPQTNSTPTQLAERPAAADTQKRPSITRDSEPQDKSQATTPLSPGWYQDPSGTLGTLYWDGQAWRSAPLPTADLQVVDRSSTPRGSSRMRMGVIATAAVLLAAAAGLTLWNTTRAGPPAGPSVFTATQQPGAMTVQPTLTAARTPTSTATRPPSTVASSPTSSMGLPRPTYWGALVIGTCDEGGTCGVKQRAAPFNESERLVPDDLLDNMPVTVVCQTIGDFRSNQGQGSSYTWYRLYNGAYVSSVYLDVRGSGIPAC